VVNTTLAPILEPIVEPIEDPLSNLPDGNEAIEIGSDDSEDLEPANPMVLCILVLCSVLKHHWENVLEAGGDTMLKILQTYWSSSPLPFTEEQLEALGGNKQTAISLDDNEGAQLPPTTSAVQTLLSTPRGVIQPNLMFPLTSVRTRKHMPDHNIRLSKWHANSCSLDSLCDVFSVLTRWVPTFWDNISPVSAWVRDCACHTFEAEYTQLANAQQVGWIANMAKMVWWERLLTPYNHVGSTGCDLSATVVLTKMW